MWDCKYDDSPTLENYLSGAVKLVKNSNIEKYKYSGYGIEFDRRATSSVANGFGKYVIIFAVYMSSFVHVENTKNIFQFLVKALHKD